MSITAGQVPSFEEQSYLTILAGLVIGRALFPDTGPLPYVTVDAEQLTQYRRTSCFPPTPDENPETPKTSFRLGNTIINNS